MPSNITKFLAFQDAQGGVLTPKLASQYLGLTRQAVNHAKKRKKLASMEVSGVTYYGYRSLRLYKHLKNARKSMEGEFEDIRNSDTS
jgi:hypothetical protein